MQVFIKKNTYLYVFLVFMLSVYKNNSYAYLDAAGNFFIEAGQSFNIHSSTKVTQEKTELIDDPDAEIVEGEEPEKKEQKTINIVNYKAYMLQPRFQGSLAFGYKPNDSLFSYFFQYDSFNIYYNYRNNSKVGASAGEEVSFTADVLSVNIQYDLFSWSVVKGFTRVGLGFMQLNQNRKNAAGGYKLEFMYQASIGIYYSVTDYLDLYCYYRFMNNISKRTEVSALGLPSKYDLLDGSLYLSLRFNL